MKIDLSKFTIKKCSLTHLDDILLIQSKAFEDLPSANLLRKNTDQTLAECLSSPHVTMGAWYNDRMAAFSILYYPYTDKENLSLSLEGIDVVGVKSANNKLCIVSREFRGNSLQYELGRRLEAFAVASGTKLMCATVSPDNIYSYRNIIRLGFIYNKTLIKYEEYVRDLFYKFI